MATMDRGSAWRAAVAAGAVAVALYVGTLGHGFTYDDEIVVERHDVVRSGRVLAAFTTPYHHGPDQRVPTYLYRPLTIASLALNGSVHSLHPAGYHAVNLILHALVSALVVFLGLAAGLGSASAIAGALLFAVHPVHVEAVAAVAGRADLLATLFSLLALLAYAKLRDPGHRPTGGGLLAASGLFGLALLSKESAAAIPLVALAWDVLVLRPAGASIGAYLRQRSRDLSLAAAAFAAPVVAYLALRAVVLGGLLVPAASMTPIENPMVGLPPLERLMTGAVVAARSLGLLVFPWRLSPDYGHAEIVAVTSPGEPRFLIAALALVLAASGVILAALRSRAVALLSLFSVSAWVLVSNLFVLIGTVMAERLLYLPSVGFCLLVGAALGRLARPRGPSWALAAGLAVLALLSAKTVTAAAAWKNELTLFTAARKATPRSVRVLGNLGGELAEAGRLEEARERLIEAVRIAPDFIPNRINLSGVYLKMGRLDEAEEQLRRALETESGSAVAHLQLGVVRERQDDPAGAEDAYRKAVEADPYLPDARLRLASVALRRGDADLARTHLETVLARNPRSVPALYGLGLAALHYGDPREAVLRLERAASLAPSDAAIHRDLEAARRAVAD